MIGLPVVVGIDDGTVALEAERDRNAPGGISPLAEACFMGRGEGIAVIWAAHAFGSVSPQVRHNTETLIIPGAQGDDLQALARAIGANAEQTARLLTLQRGEAVVFARSLWPAPVFGFFPYVTCKVDERVLQERAERFLRRVVAEPGGKPAAAPKTERIPAEALRLLIEAAFHCFLGLTVLYTRAGLDRMAGRRAGEQLHALGVVRPHKFSSGQRGGLLILLEVTDEGWKELSARGFERPLSPTKGGFEHNTVALAIEELGHRGGDEVRFERLLNGVFADVTRQSPDGQLCAFQIGLGDPKREAANLKKLASAGGVNEAVLVVKDKKFLANVSALLKGKLTAEEEAKVRLCCVGEILQQVQ